MANKIIQYRYPYSNLPSSFSTCKLGISISEDEFMQLSSSSPYQGFSFDINGQTIYMGKTCMYEMDDYIEIDDFSFNPTDVKTVIIQAIFKE